MTINQFTWGETVKVSLNAPKMYRPGQFAEICSLWEIQTKENSEAHGEPVGSMIYSIEFSDGTLIDIPGRYLKKYS